MAHYHSVQQGECLSSIAALYGFTSYRLLLDCPENAGLKSQREDPNLLLPGDRVFIPDKKPKVEDRPTDTQHRFVLQRKRVYLELTVQVDQEPVANAPYQLKVGNEIYTGSTSGEGSLSHEIDALAKQGTLEIQDPPLLWDLSIGALDPPNTISGIQARLANLGFPCGAADGKLGPRTRGALRRFQVGAGLEATGNPDAVTVDRLKKEAGG